MIDEADSREQSAKSSRSRGRLLVDLATERWSAMCDALVVGSEHDMRLLGAIEVWLRRAGLGVSVAEASVARAHSERRRARTLVAVVPSDSDPERAELLRAMRDAVKIGSQVVAVARVGDRIPLSNGSLFNVVRMGENPESLRARLLESVLDPGPFRCIVVPGVTAPTGVAAWTSTQVVVSCDDSGRVVAVDAVSGRSITLVTGLVEPHGVSVDRRTLLVALKGSHSILVGELVDGRFAPRREIGFRRPPALRCPHFATQLVGEVLVVDTDNDRVLRAQGHVLGRVGRFEPLALDTTLRAPCGAALYQDAVVIADTFHDRVVVARDGHAYTCAELNCPAPVQVAIAPSGELLVIATDGLHIFRLSLTSTELAATKLAYLPAGGCHTMRAPFGVSVDRAGKVYVADRGRCAVWVADLGDLVAHGQRDAA